MLGKNEKHPNDIKMTRNCSFKLQRFTGVVEDDMEAPESLRLYRRKVFG
jgi:hypothetical protein